MIELANVGDKVCAFHSAYEITENKEYVVLEISDNSAYLIEDDAGIADWYGSWWFNLTKK